MFEYSGEGFERKHVNVEEAGGLLVDCFLQLLLSG